MDIINSDSMNSQLLCWPCRVLGARTEVKGQPWQPSSQEELQDSSSTEHSCIKHDINLVYWVYYYYYLLFVWLSFQAPLEFEWSPRPVHPPSQWTEPWRWLAQSYGERERERQWERKGERERERCHTQRCFIDQLTPPGTWWRGHRTAAVSSPAALGLASTQLLWPDEQTYDQS